MSSGADGTAADGGGQGPHAAEAHADLAAQGDGLGAVEAVGAAGAGAAGPACGRARPGALAAVEAAAAVAHGRLATAAAEPGLGPAARRRPVIAGWVAVLEPTAAGSGRRDGDDVLGAGGDDHLSKFSIWVEWNEQ
jgi:predicted component of type VI protein secretion system